MADNMMANPLSAALWGPDVMQKQYQVQQNQRIADMLMAQSQQPLQGQMVSGHYVPASPLQGVSNLVNALISRKTMDNIPSQQYDIANMQNQQMQQGFGVGGGQGGQPAQMDGGQTNPSQGYGGQGGQYPLLPGRSANESYQTALAVGFPKYMEMVASQLAPNDPAKNLIQSGVRPGSPEWQQAMGGVAAKDRYIAPPVIAPGGTALNPQTNMPMFNSPQGGVGMTFGPDGKANAYAVPNYAQIESTNKGMEADAVSRAQAGNKVITAATGPNQTKQYRTEGEAIDATKGASPLPVEPDNKTQNAGDIQTYIEQANKLLGNASSGFFSKLGTAATDTIGISTDKSKADAQLKVVSGNLVLKMPRMEGPQSDADRKLYQSMAADVANPDIPVASRHAALKTLQELNNKYLPQSQQGAPNAPTPDSNGIYKPKTKAEWDALPAGSRAYNSKGQLVTKP